MPDVADRAAVRDPQARTWFSRCGNPRCPTGWMHLWRSRSVPVFEQQWTCSPGCMEAVVAAAILREGNCAGPVRSSWSHRIPIGLVLVEQGVITATQLRTALEDRRCAADREDERLGEWLVRSGVLTETALTRGLCAQWNCPAYSLRDFRPGETISLIPRLLVELTGAVPLRVAAGRLLHLAFRGALDRSVSYAVERATGLRVAGGILADREFRIVLAQYLGAPAPHVEFLETDDAPTLARALARRMEREKPLEARLVRVRDFYWLRLRRRAQAPGTAGVADVEDILCRLSREMRAGTAGEARQAVAGYRQSGWRR